MAVALRGAGADVGRNLCARLASGFSSAGGNDVGLYVAATASTCAELNRYRDNITTMVRTILSTWRPNVNFRLGAALALLTPIA